MRGIMEDTHRRRHEIARPAAIDIHELLRITVGQGEPRALYLHHDAVTFRECMCHISQREPDTCHLIWHKRLGLCEAVAIASTHDVAPDEHLIARLFAVFVGKHVNQLDNIVGIGGRYAGT